MIVIEELQIILTKFLYSDKLYLNPKKFIQEVVKFESLVEIGYFFY
jgi:hypothetical protein